MTRPVLFLLLLLTLSTCNPLILDVPKTEIIEFTVGPGHYVQVGGTDYIRISNAEIESDREIEVYIYPVYLSPPSDEPYWGMLVDVDIYFSDEGGEMLIKDPMPHSYEGKDIRVIITWDEEEEYQNEKG